MFEVFESLIHTIVHKSVPARFSPNTYAGSFLIYTKFDLKLLSNWYILTKGMLKYYMDAKYHKAANVVSGCEANPNLDSLMKYQNNRGNQQHPWWGS